jgi:hypothetical protein
LGTSLVYVSVFDGCGNLKTCSFKVHVRDTKKPTPVCHHGLSVSLMATGMVELKAPLFDGGSFDNCSQKSEMTYEIKPATFTCKNVGPNLVTFIVTDKSGNSDFCTTYVEIQDNMKMCNDTTSAKAAIAGAITTTANVGIEKTDIMVNGTTSLISTITNGNFMLYKPVGYNYSIKPEKDDDILNGVTTFDLVKMNKHILGLDVLTEPTALLAADVDKNNKVTTADIVALRKVILGISKGFPNGQKSWRFYQKDYVLPTNPFSAPLPESSIMSLLSDTKLDFTGIKVGDLNGSAKANSASAVAPRGLGETIAVHTEDIMLESGKTYHIPLIIKEKDLQGLQFTLQYSDALELKNIVPSQINDLNENNFAVVENGTITASWHTTKTSKEETFVTLEFLSKANMQLSEALALNSAITAAEGYYKNDETGKVNLEFTAAATAKARPMELFQNQPNPFSEVTQIRFYLPEATSATISVMDITGKIVYSKRDEFSSGNHVISFNKRELTNLTTGIFYYQLQTAKQSLTKKMIIVE